MTVTEIPKSFRYTCDASDGGDRTCREVHIQESANGHYWESTPPGWASIRVVRIKADGADTPNGWSDPEIRRLYCPRHRAVLEDSLP